MTGALYTSAQKIHHNRAPSRVSDRPTSVTSRLSLSATFHEAGQGAGGPLGERGFAIAGGRAPFVGPPPAPLQKGTHLTPPKSIATASGAADPNTQKRDAGNQRGAGLPTRKSLSLRAVCQLRMADPNPRHTLSGTLRCAVTVRT